MKKFLSITACLLLAITSFLCVNSKIDSVQAETNTNEIVVYGTGIVKIAPDTAVVRVGVETVNPEISVAVEENNNSISKIIEFLKSTGINEEDIETKNYTAWQKYDYSEGEKFVGYQVSNNLEFKCKDLNNLGSIITDLTDIGVNRLGGITFTCSDMETHYNEALKVALENAKAKAKALTSSELKIVKIKEQNTYSTELYHDTAFVLARANKETVMKGNMQIEAKIEVVFEG